MRNADYHKFKDYKTSSGFEIFNQLRNIPQRRRRLVIFRKKKKNAAYSLLIVSIFGPKTSV